ncbi:V-type ATPase subunit [Candidatus Micrarchaeota archaeon]|nr:V-type ATPase subunit [Candidatus Micrarchaeota archaeon]
MGFLGFISRYLPSLESRALKYGYSNARVKAMKGLILKPSTLEEMVKVATIDAMIELLQRTNYKDDFTSLSISYKGSDLVELALTAHFAKIIRSTLKFIPKSDKLYLQALLKRVDLLNLKTLINAKRTGKQFKDIRPYLIPAGSLSEVELERIANSENIVQELRRTALGHEIFELSTKLFTRQALESFKQAVKSSDTIFQIQTLLDLYLYSYLNYALASSKPDILVFRKLFRNEIDIKNIVIIERLKGRGIDKSSINTYLIKGGRLPESTLQRLIDTDDLDKTVEIINSKLPIKLLQAPKTTVELEISLERALAAQKLRIFYRSTLSVGTILGFLLLKEEELNNIRKIAKGKEYGLSETKIRETLITV